MMIDRDITIELTGMEFHAFHGCLEQERKEGNTFVVDFRGKRDGKRPLKLMTSRTPLTIARSMR